MYSPEEDRLLFRVNTTDHGEYRFWFSRRYTILLLRVLQEPQSRDPDVVLQQAPEAPQAFQAFKQEQSAQTANMSKQFEASAQRPLDEDAILAHRLTYRIDDDQLNLGMHPRKGKASTSASIAISTTTSPGSSWVLSSRENGDFLNCRYSTRRVPRRRNRW